MAIKTHLDVGPLDDNFILLAEEERVEAKMIHTQVHPSLARDPVFPIATGVIFSEEEQRKDQVRLTTHRINVTVTMDAILTADEFFFSWHSKNFLKSMNSCNEVGRIGSFNLLLS